MSEIEPVLPSKPLRHLPPNACDSHAHVFGPFDRFPLAPERSYTPPFAPVDAYWRMLRHMGFARAVVVQASAYGTDNRCTEDAVVSSSPNMRGIGVVAPDVSEDDLARLAAHGFRGMRFTEIVSKRYAGRIKGAVGFAELLELGSRLKQHGMHAQIFAVLDDFIAAAPALLELGIPLVLDHMARLGPGERKVNDPAFQTLLGLLREGRVWVKLTAFRNSERLPNYEDVRPFHTALLQANPDRLIWGSDWPLLNMGDKAPDIGHLIDLLFDWTQDDALIKRIFVENPAKLYGFDS